ncbi:MAG: carbohydrate ABC transporter permease [Armatimonadota bacterium]
MTARIAGIPMQLATIGAGLILAAFLLGPIIWMVSSSLQFDADLFTVPPQLIPRQPTLDNYTYVITRKAPPSYSGEITGRRASGEALSLMPALKNSFIVATTVTIFNLLFSTLAAYTYARLRFRGRDFTYAFILTSRLIPAISVAIPISVLVTRLGLLDTHWALIGVYLAFTLPFTMWFLMKYFAFLPVEVEEAALIDGCTRFGALRRIVAPMAAPGLAAAAAFAFMGSYSEFLFALFLTRTMASKTAPLILVATAINHDVSFALSFAALVLAMIPAMAFALIFRSYITRGFVSAFGR